MIPTTQNQVIKFVFFLICFYFLQMVEKISDELAASTRSLLQSPLFSLQGLGKQNKTTQPTTKQTN